MDVMYATREYVLSSLETVDSSRQGKRVDATIRAASRSVEGLLHRIFYPEIRTINLDWPNNAYFPAWQVELDDNEMVSLTTVVSGGNTITSGCYLSRGDSRAEAPYSLLNVDLSTSANLSAGDTWQRSLAITGLFGYNDTDTSLPDAALSGAINDSVTTVVLNPASGVYDIGIGAIIKLDSERLMITDRRMSSIGITTSSTLNDAQSSASFTTAGASSLSIGEVILIDSERMRINDIAGSTVLVSRAWDGTVLAAHVSGSTIYGLRTATVKRGVLGTTAASHTDATSVYIHRYPPLVTELTAAESIVILENTAAGYARTIGTGAGTKVAPSAGLDDIRERAYRQLGRKLRSAGV